VQPPTALHVRPVGRRLANESSECDVRLPVDGGDAPASNSINSALSSATMALIALACALIPAGALLVFVLWRRDSARRPPPAAAKGVSVRVQQVQRPQAQATGATCWRPPPVCSALLSFWPAGAARRFPSVPW
jgi:hypothetical protein